MSKPNREPTAAEINALVAQQYANLPAWWDSAAPKASPGDDPTGEYQRERDRRRQWGRRQKRKAK